MESGKEQKSELELAIELVMSWDSDRKLKFDTSEILELNALNLIINEIHGFIPAEVWILVAQKCINNYVLVENLIKNPNPSIPHVVFEKALELCETESEDPGITNLEQTLFLSQNPNIDLKLFNRIFNKILFKFRFIDSNILKNCSNQYLKFKSLYAETICERYIEQFTNPEYRYTSNTRRAYLKTLVNNPATHTPAVVRQLLELSKQGKYKSLKPILENSSSEDIPIKLVNKEEREKRKEYFVSTTHKNFSYFYPFGNDTNTNNPVFLFQQIPQLIHNFSKDGLWNSYT